MTARVTVFLRGRVQGVGMRWWVRARALELGLAGHARNTADGRVEVVAEGERARIEDLLAALAPQAAPPGRPGTIVSVSEPLESEPRGAVGFAER